MNTIDWQSRLNAALSWIEDHLTEDWSWEEAAAEANCSVFHFLRMFEVVTGTTAGEYLRRRRLSEAARALAAGGATGEVSVADIASRYGYESADAFSRAFRRLYGMSPSEARLPGAFLAAYNPLAVVLSLRGSEPMKYRLERQGPGLVAALADHDEEREDFLYVVGVLLGSVPGEDRDGEASPPASSLAASTAPLPAGMLRLGLPAATWVVFEAEGPFPSALQALWPRVWSEWFAQSGLEAAEAPRLEVYPPGDRLSPRYRAGIRVPLARSAADKA